MKTLLIALEFPPQIGGMETFYAKLAEHWPEEIRVLDNSSGGLVKRGWLRGVFTALREIRTYGPDWVLASDLLPIGIIVWLVSFMLPFRYAVFLHGLDFTLALRRPRKRWLSQRILRRAAAVIAVNSYTAAEVSRIFPEVAAKVSIVNPGAEITAAPSEATRAGLRQNYDLEAAFLITTIGRLVTRKGVDMVLRALPEVIKEIPELRYAIIGQGPALGYVQGIVAELQLEARVLILSDLDQRTKDAWLSLADVFIMPARDIDGDYEGFGIVYLEANALGKPVIAGLSGGVGDAVIDGLNGLRVNENDPSAIAAAIIRLYRDPNLREQLGRQGRERTKEFSWKLQVQKIFAILN